MLVVIRNERWRVARLGPVSHNVAVNQIPPQGNTVRPVLEPRISQEENIVLTGKTRKPNGP